MYIVINTLTTVHDRNSVSNTINKTKTIESKKKKMSIHEQVCNLLFDWFRPIPLNTNSSVRVSSLYERNNVVQ